MIKQLCPEMKKKKLVDLYKTRWVARHEALETFLELYELVVETMPSIQDDSPK